MSVTMIVALCGLGGASAFLAAALWVFLYRRRSKRILEQLQAMLKAAKEGQFREDVFNESMVSAVETEMAHYLARQQGLMTALQEEKNSVKVLLSDISHQTKTPISNILLYAQLLQEEALTEKGSMLVNSLYAQTEKLHFLIDTLIKTSRLESGKFQMHPKAEPVAPLLQAVEETVRQRAEGKRIYLQVEKTDEVAVFDPKWTGEALYNIIDNAIKYTEEGGEIIVKTEGYPMFCRIVVSDSGIGISEEEQAKIFMRFYRSPSVSGQEGIGIGLYLARQIIGGQNGYIRVESEIGKGSVFSVFFTTTSINISILLDLFLAGKNVERMPCYNRCYRDR